MLRPLRQPALEQTAITQRDGPQEGDEPIDEWQPEGGAIGFAPGFNTADLGDEGNGLAAGVDRREVAELLGLLSGEGHRHPETTVTGIGHGLAVMGGEEQIVRHEVGAELIRLSRNQPSATAHPWGASSSPQR